ncbi:MAG TPA: alternative ribosome rescue aminoacyl-tRNA hydrolase ArfB [Devosiaceae bacterium]|jgi:ribosome-associated protein|nr:alternative ribosome rescue aminoacyl-tRNA hydrolase ArfB [Devosiaceae bacterium]
MADPIPVTENVAIEPAELDESFIRASGPGGQNVNKVASAVQLRFDLRNSPSLPQAVKARVARLAGSRLTKDGVIVITADNFRNQQQNREDALERLLELLRQGTVVPKRRRPTRPTLASKQRRLAAKSQRGNIKRLRTRRPEED